MCYTVLANRHNLIRICRFVKNVWPIPCSNVVILSRILTMSKMICKKTGKYSALLFNHILKLYSIYGIIMNNNIICVQIIDESSLIELIKIYALLRIYGQLLRRIRW